MKRRIYITEETANRLFESLEIPAHLLADVDNHKTSLGDNPAFPPVGDVSYEHVAAMKRYDELKSEFGEEMGVDEKLNLLSSTISRIQELEEGNESALEKLCFNIINKLFSIPSGTITFRCHITQNLQPFDREIRAKSEDSPNMKFANVAQIKELKSEVFKRRIINALIMGASIRYSNLPKEFIGDAYEISPELPKLYKDFNKLNNILLFEKELPEITEDNKLQGGFVRVKLGAPGERTTIESYGNIFPVLLAESIRGFMELFASHGLPKDKAMADFIVKKADFAAAEPWDMRLGPVMWKSITDNIGNLETRYLPAFFTKLTELDGDNFAAVMAEILGETEYGGEILQSMADEVRDEIDYEDFEDDIAMKNLDKNMLSDEYLRPDELEIS